MKLLHLPAIAILTLLLSACSPHPGAGNWQASGQEDPDFIREFVRLEVGYEGRTDIYAEQADSAEPAQEIRRCFWRGQDPQTIMLTCTQASNPDIEESYQLRVGPDNKIAELIKDELVVGRFEREERAEIEHSYKEILQPR